jgi:triacylglycerol lipase
MLALGAACSTPREAAPDAGASADASIDARVALDAPATPAFTPILFVHGINGDAANFDALKARLIADGWPAGKLFGYTFSDPSWGCNVDNAASIEDWVDMIIATTGSTKINVIAHSMGTLSSRHFVKQMGGTAKVARYITLGGMHHGLSSSCAAMFPGAPCVWRELCETGAFVAALNAAPATPGNLHWISIYGTSDETVPNASSQLVGAENIAITGVTHEGLLDDNATYAEIVRVLAYPAL